MTHSNRRAAGVSRPAARGFGSGLVGRVESSRPDAGRKLRAEKTSRASAAGFSPSAEPAPRRASKARPDLRKARAGHPFRALLVALAAAAALPAVAADPLPVAPPPRRVQPDGSREPAPAENPTAVVERIIANAKKASDKLAAADAGADTRATQSGILKDIDALLNPPDSPPKGGGGDSNDMNKQDKSDSKDNTGNDKSDKKQNDGTGSGQKEQKGDGQTGKGGPDPKDGMNPGGTEPKGGTGQDKDGMNPGGMGQKEGQASDRRPRAGAPKDGKEPGGTAQGGKKSDKQPMNPGQLAKAGTPTDPAGTAGGAADKKSDQPPPPIQPQLPLADVVAKEVWGHLPERVRMQLTQHYREEFMPRYAGLLRQYYSSLSGGAAGPPPPPR